MEYQSYQILDCDEAKMRQNNIVVTGAFAKGYKVLNGALINFGLCLVS